MSGPGNTLSETSRDPWERCERIVEQFEAAWRQGERPAIEAFLPAEGPDRGLLLLELVHTDLECRLQAGEPALVEDYLGRFPELARAPDTVLALLAAEYELRRRDEPTLDWAEYAGRFPHLAAELGRRCPVGGSQPGSSREDDPATTLTETVAAEGATDAPAYRGGPGRYRSLRLHAKGGLGEVLVAHDEELEREVALKRLQAAWADNRDSRRRFLREARITARLQHPGIVPVYGLVRDEHGRPCYAMRLVEGESLKDAIADFHKAEVPGRDPGERSLALRELLTRFVAVCNTLAYAHDRGIIHRDLKPSNVLLGQYGETLVVDWGLAKPYGPAGAEAADDVLTPAGGDGAGEATQVGQALGTPAYMSPEQAAGRWDLVGPASDVYSLGATLYHLLTGHVPVGTGNLEEALAKARRGDFPRPREVKPATPPALEAVCLKALARHPGDRYPGALDLARDVERWLADEPVSVWRGPLPVRLARWGRRHRTAVVAAGVTLAFLLAGGTAGPLLWQTAEQRRHDYLTTLRSSAEASAGTALHEAQAGRFDNAEQILARALPGVGAEPSLATVRARLEAQRDRAGRLAGFYERANRAERLEAEQSTRPDNFADSGAAEVCEAGLTGLGVFEHDDWWRNLPEQDLTAEQRARLREDVYHQLILLGAVRAKKGLHHPGGPEMDAALRAGLLAVEAANRFRPDSYAGGRMEAFAHMMLREPGKVHSHPAARPSSASDFYFSGLLHLGIGITTNPDEHRGLMDRLFLSVAGSVAPLDFEHPLQTAERHLRLAAEKDPQHYWSHCWLGLTLAKEGKMDAAELAWSTCVSLRPSYPTAHCFRAEALLHRRERTADPAARRWLLDQALADCNRALEFDPGSALAYRNRGDGYVAAGDPARALADYDAAVRLQPDCGPAFLERGQCHLRLREYDAAVADLDQALKLVPGLAEAYWGRGNARALQGDYRRAADDLGRAIGLDSGNAAYHRDRGLVEARLREWGKALADFARATELRPEDAEAWERVVLLRLRQGDVDGCRRACAALLDRLGKTTDPATAHRVARACVLAPGGPADPARVVEVARRAADADRASAAYRITLGAALYRRGDWERAAGVLRAALDGAGPLEASAGRLFLAMAEARLGHADEADACLARARSAAAPAGACDPLEGLRLQALVDEADRVARECHP